MELFIKKAMELEDEAEREAAIIHIGKLMKTFFNVWNRDSVEDAVVIRNIEELSNGKLTISLDKVKEFGLFESKRKPDFHNRNHHNNNNNRNRNNKRNNNQKRRRN